ncbi:imidazole glycerol phosphate synthase subunit HisH [Iodidimonas nitroreducens]|uniref:Imidazole glycerol phosphate synthase subunit HisH n=1 Tax=Iodidimonas nitroreducens TaxID=1236968 RepID=A0A5A7N3Z7_9PROT|nr:imidazole glycerol phosphate synthase subunit HisH [Iodidimonas nitroreducens]GAK34805.1 imidazole glycerol phosphate synthase subunit HisH [alpha proteobacterium Q-1]GER02474.1 imidazole glycerol phosphate synthase subunit HisH [Iodidimonas nitroreducens]
MAQTLVVIDYGSGNLRSVSRALQRVALDAGLSFQITVTGDPAAVRKADRILLPGVGAFGDCRAGIDAIPDMMAAIEQVALHDARPFLGICVGMQLLASRGLEHGEHQGFGWIPGTVEAIRPQSPDLKIPHMGWNALELTEAGEAHPLFAGIAAGDHAYFVHSYHLALQSPEACLARVHHGMALTAAVARGNVAGVQFHPEKSQTTGLRFLRNFLEWQP